MSQSNPSSGWARFAARFLGVILWIYLVLSLDMTKVTVLLERVEWAWIFLAVLSVSATIALKASRWNMFLGNVGAKLKYPEALGTVISSVFWASVTPGRIGELYRFKPFVGNSDRLLRAFASVVLDRMYDVVLLVAWSSVGLLYFWNLLPGRTSVFYAASLLLAGAGVFVILIMWERIAPLIEAASIKLLPRSIIPAGGFRLLTFREYLLAAFKGHRVLAFSMSLLALMISFVGIFWVGLALGVHVPFLYLSVTYTIAALVSLVPISFGGLGTREAVFIYYLGNINVSAESALLLSFTVTVAYNILLPALFSLLFSAVVRLTTHSPSVSTGSESGEIADDSENE